MPAGSILVADDDTAIRTVLNQALSRAGYEVRLTGNAATLWRWVSQGEGDLVITDVVMPERDAFDLLPRIKKMRPNLPVIVMSAQNTFMTAIRACRTRRVQYCRTVRPEGIDRHRRPRAGRTQGARRQSCRRGRVRFDSAGRRSPAMQEIYRVLARLMQTDLTVMISGESGTARNWSRARCMTTASGATGRLSPVNMAAIPRDLIESELFGHERGAFTGANTAPRAASSRPKAARYSSTNRDMPMEAQTRLLRVLQQANTPPSAAVPRSRRCAHRRCEQQDLRILIQQGLFAKICSSASMWCRCGCLPCASASRICPI